MADQLTASQRKALNTGIHISLAANAGSGKTHVLKKRYAELLSKKDVFPQNIAAITFTEKAASELYTKIRAEIENYISNTELPSEIRNDLKKKKRLLSSARISTIHSFCSEILRDFAIEAGVDPGFTPVDDTISREILEKAVEKVLQQTYDDAEMRELQLSLQMTLGGYGGLRNALISAVLKRGKLIPFFRALQSLDEHSFLKKADDYLLRITSDIEPDAVLSVKKSEDGLNDADASALYEKAALLADRIKSKKADPSIRDLNTVREFNKNLYQFNLNFSKLFTLAAEQYDEGKREMNFLDHDDLILKARDVVMNKESEVSSHLNNKYRYIMIDEYQDTDDAQFDIFVSKLREMTQEKPNLFIVGDEKQSIYMFRNAEPQIFRETREMIGGLDPEGVITLAESFRMSKELCAFNNILFSQIFQNQIKSFNSVAPEELIYARKEDENPLPPHIELLLSSSSEGEKSSSDQQKAQQAALIAQRIRKLAQEKSVTSLDQIGILLFRNDDALFLQKAFADYQIPHIFSGRATQFSDQVTADIINLFKFIADQKNDIALTGLLRSPFFMLSDKEIYQIAETSGFFLWEKLAKLESGPAQVSKARQYLISLLSLAKIQTPTEILRRIFSETRYIEISSAIIPPDSLFAQIRSLSDRIRVFEEDQNFTLYELIVYLEELRSIKGKEDPVFSEKSKGAVNIMTIHASKGLEFNTVFIFNSARELKGGGASESLIISPSFGVIPKFTSGEKELFPLIGAFEQYLRKMREQEETKRLYYVACTRATDQLIFTADRADKTDTPSLYSSLVNTFAIEPSDAIKTFEKDIKVLSRPSMEHLTEKQQFSIAIRTQIDLEGELQSSDQNTHAEHEITLSRVSSLKSYKHLSTRMIPVSAVLAYYECPHKYRLVQELRLANFTSLLDEAAPLTGSSEAADSGSLRIQGALYGSIIHKAIEFYKPGLSEEEFRQIIIDQFHQLRYAPQNIKDEIFADITKIISSKEFGQLYSPDSISEYDIRAIIGGYYLTSRIDYFLRKEDKITIADYKTNKLSNLTKETLERYGLQLDIYALLAKILFPEVTSVETVLYITRDPSRSVRKQYSADDFSRTEKLVSRILQNIFSGEEQIPFTVCSDCILKREGFDCEQFFTSRNR